MDSNTIYISQKSDLNIIKKNLHNNNINLLLYKNKLILPKEFLNNEILKKILSGIDYKFSDLVKEETFGIIGISCSACVISIENILKDIIGVLDVKVNLFDNTVTINYIPQIVSKKIFQDTLKEYDYHLLTENIENQDDASEKIYKEYLKNSKISSIALIFIMIFMFFKHNFYVNLAVLLITSYIVIRIGKTFYISAYKKIKHLSTNMDTLISMGSLIAYSYSFITFIISIITKNFHQHYYFEASAAILTFVTIGKTIEHKAQQNTTKALKKLLKLQSKTAIKITGDLKTEIPIEQIQPNDILLARIGDKIAVDGEIIEGESYIDESSFTGETMPLFKSKGDKVYAGTINISEPIYYKAIKVGKDTVLAKIIESIKNAQASKTKIQLLADKVSAIFTPLILSIALINFFSWIIISNDINFAIKTSISVIVIACPCALGLATPAAVAVGLSVAAKYGILIKKAYVFEIIPKIDTIVFDKTGTLTEGILKVSNSYFKKNDDLYKKILVNIELLSNHPIARAIISHFGIEKNINIENFKNIPSKGIIASYNGKHYMVGNKKLIEEYNIELDQDIINFEKEALERNNTVIFFIEENKCIGIISLEDSIKPGTKKTIEILKKHKKELFILTGDNEKNAEYIAQQLKINYIANLLPQQKLDFIENLQKKGKKVLMIGDGLNDSAAITKADVGISLNTGSDITISASDITLMSNSLEKIIYLFKISKNTLNKIKQNLFWAFIYNIITLPIAAGLFYKNFGLILNPVISSILMTISSISVVTNSILLKYKKYEKI